MPRYYFGLHDEGTTIDRQGVEFVDANAALVFAYAAARKIASASAANGRLVARYRIDIVDDHRRLIDSVTYGEAVISIADRPD